MLPSLFQTFAALKVKHHLGTAQIVKIGQEVQILRNQTGLQNFFNSLCWKQFEMHLKIVSKKECGRLGGKIIKDYGQEILLGNQSISYLLKTNPDEFMKGFEDNVKEGDGEATNWVFPTEKEERKDEDNIPMDNPVKQVDQISNKANSNLSQHDAQAPLDADVDVSVEIKLQENLNGPKAKAERSKQLKIPVTLLPSSQVHLELRTFKEGNPKFNRVLFRDDSYNKEKGTKQEEDENLQTFDGMPPGSPAPRPYQKRKGSMN